MSISSKREWLQGPYAKAIARAPERSKAFETTGKMPIEPVYTPDDLAGWDANVELGFPGEYPFTRGIQPTMYRGRFWTMRQYAGFGTAEESNQRYRYLLAQGQTGLSVAFDLPTQIGYDSDRPDGRGRSRQGRRRDRFDRRHGDPVPRHPAGQGHDLDDDQRDGGDPAALYIAVGKQQGVPPTSSAARSRTTSSRNTSPAGPTSTRRSRACASSPTSFAYCKRQRARSGTRSRSPATTCAKRAARPPRRSRSRSPMASPTSRPRSRPAWTSMISPAGLSFFFACHNNFLEEVAKFRAARRLWAKIMNERFEAKNPRSWMLRFHTQTGGATLTAQQPENNIVRTAVQALAAVLGGTQSLHTNSLGRGARAPDRARRPDGPAHAADPRLRERRRRRRGPARRLVLHRRPDRTGSKPRPRSTSPPSTAWAARSPRIEQGFQQREIQEAAYRFQRQIEEKERIIVGVNDFITHERRPTTCCA